MLPPKDGCLINLEVKCSGYSWAYCYSVPWKKYAPIINTLPKSIDNIIIRVVRVSRNKIWRSSAYSMQLRFWWSHRERGAIQKTKSKDPRVDTCATPHSIHLDKGVRLNVYLHCKGADGMNLFNVDSWNIDFFFCRFNYLNISDGNHLIGHYCGNLTGKVIFVSRDYLVLTFHSNENFDPNKKGFEIFFTDDVNMPGKWI